MERYRYKIKDYFWYKYRVDLGTDIVCDSWTIADAFEEVCQRWPQDAVDKLNFFVYAGGDIDELFMRWIKVCLKAAAKSDQDKFKNLSNLTSKFNKKCIKYNLSEKLRIFPTKP